MLVLWPQREKSVYVLATSKLLFLFVEREEIVSKLDLPEATTHATRILRDKRYALIQKAQNQVIPNEHILEYK